MGSRNLITCLILYTAQNAVDRLNLLNEHLLSVGERPLKLLRERHHPPRLVRQPADVAVQLRMERLSKLARCFTITINFKPVISAPTSLPLPLGLLLVDFLVVRPGAVENEQRPSIKLRALSSLRGEGHAKLEPPNTAVKALVI